MVCSAGRATSGKIPISKPSNIQPRKAAANTSHGELLSEDVFNCWFCSRVLGTSLTDSFAPSAVNSNLKVFNFSPVLDTIILGPVPLAKPHRGLIYQPSGCDAPPSCV